MSGPTLEDTVRETLEVFREAAGTVPSMIGARARRKRRKILNGCKTMVDLILDTEGHLWALPLAAEFEELAREMREAT